MDVIYETDAKFSKYISIVNGFTHVGSAPVSISLKGFKTPEMRKTSTDLSLVVLEGNSGVTFDQCVIASSKLQKVWTLKSQNRAHNNFLIVKFQQLIKASLASFLVVEIR
ncbi:hypothetical protein CW732_03080 [Olleya sp. Bg11-27]|nr:hypothetical protein CW732_03080 [Olleya sp. Bg11-27]